MMVHIIFGRPELIYMDHIAIILAIMLSIVLPLSIIASRQSVKLNRQRIIQDLELVFDRNQGASNGEPFLASFEFVKFKYYLPSKLGDPRGREGSRSDKTIKDYSIASLILASIPLVVLSSLAGTLTLSLLFQLAYPNYRPTGYLFAIHRNPVDLKLWQAVFIVSYLAAYLFIIRDMLRSVANFDFGPTTLLSGAIHLLYGITTATLIATVADRIFPASATLPIVLIAAFSVGFIPELGLRAILRSTELRLFKQEDRGVYEAYSATPLEVVDGIDSEIRSRLSLFGIQTVQHLAAANPFLLFVETPYGIYQVFDWVSQAQLFAAVGANKVTKLWEISIRTIFDLERAVFSKNINPEIIKSIADILFPAGLSAIKDVESVKGMTNIILDDLHTYRLRQIWHRIADTLGPENTRLRPPVRWDQKGFDGSK